MSTGKQHDGRGVEGIVVLDNGIPAAALALRLYSQGFGGAETRIGEAKTSADGSFSIKYTARKEAVHLELRAIDPGGAEASISTIVRPAKRVTLNLVVPAGLKLLEAEYNRLIKDLNKVLGKNGKLVDACEDGRRRDLALLHEATGWDARLIALDKLASTTGISEDALYGLLRVGLPSNEESVAALSRTAIENALRKASEAGIVDLDYNKVKTTVSAFEKFARKTRMKLRAPGSHSTVGDLLEDSGLTVDQKHALAELHVTARAQGDEFWRIAREKGIPEEKIEALRIRGKLSYLTFNNAPLIRSLQDDIASSADLSKLAASDLYKEEGWKKRITALAGNNEKALSALIPPAFVGETTSDRLDSYAAELARKVRLSFPMKVLARRVETGEIHLGENHDDVKSAISGLLSNAGELGFNLGRAPINSLLRQNGARLMPVTDGGKHEKAVEALKKLQRLYQITPSDHSLKAALNLGFGSAQDIAAFRTMIFCIHSRIDFNRERKRPSFIDEPSRSARSLTICWARPNTLPRRRRSLPSHRPRKPGSKRWTR